MPEAPACLAASKLGAGSPDLGIAKEQVIQRFCCVLPGSTTDQDWHIALQPAHDLRNPKCLPVFSLREGYTFTPGYIFVTFLHSLSNDA